MTDSKIPTAKMRVIDPENAIDEMLAFAQGLIDAGQRPWFEVRWPSPEVLTGEDQERWQMQQEDSYDAVELVDGVLVTLPPYSELLGEDD